MFDFIVLTFRCKNQRCGTGKWENGRTGGLAFRVDGAGKLCLLLKS